MVEKYKLAKKTKEEEEKRKPTDEKPDEIKEMIVKKQLLTRYNVADWKPVTILGKKVRSGEIKSLDEIFSKGWKILEPQIVDFFLDLTEKVVDVKKTSHVRMSGRKYSYRATVLIGDKRGYVGVGTEKDSDKFTAIAKAARKARLNIIKVKHGCGAWQCNCGTGHSIPFKVSGKCGGVRVELKPAPKGTGLVVTDAIKDVFVLCNIKDVWGKGFGSTATTLNFVKATIDALSKTNRW